MAFMKFYEGSEANAQSYLDGIYLATDTHKLFYKGSPYGGDPYTELDWIQDFKSGSGTMEEAAFNKLKDAVDNYKLLVVSCSGAAHSTRVCTPEIGDDGSYICKFTDINNYDNADTYILAVKIASVNPSTRAITMLHDTTYPLDIDLSNYYTIDQVDGKIGSNVYTGANYISKETNLTEAVLQLDEEIKATNDNLTLEHENAEATYAKKTELDGYLPLSGGTLTGYLKMRELDGSELKHETFSLDLVQGYLDGKEAYMKFDVHPSDYSTNRTMIEIGNLIDSNTAADSSDVLGIYSDFFQARFNPISKSFAVCNRPNTSKDVMWSNITLVPGDDDEAYVRITSYLGDSKDSSNFNQATYKSTGITFRNKTASDLLHAAGGTTTLKTINGESLLGSGDITTPTPTVNASSGTKTIWTGTQSEYEGVTSKDANTLYFITEE